MPEEFNRIYMHLLEDDGHGKPFCDDDDSMDEVLLLASQAYESHYAEEHQIGVSDRPSSSHSSAVPEVVLVKQTSPSCFIPKVNNCTEVNSEANDTSANTTRFASPKSSKSVEEVRKSAIPKKTRQNTEWTERTWHSWAKQRIEKLSPEELEKGYELDTKFANMNVASMNYWLRKFILEVRSMNGKEYSPDSLYQVCCGLHRSLKDNHRSEVNIFDDAELAEFCGVLDGQLKALNRTGKYVEKKKASIITTKMEERLWESGLLGDHNPKVLLDTLVYLIGLNFALRS